MGDTLEYCDVFRGIVWPARKDKNWSKPKKEDESDFASFTFGDLRSATCEIVKFQEIERLQQYIANAKNYEAKFDSFGKGLAGLAQNVIDYDDQDGAEVSDSLFHAESVAGCTYFVNPKAIIMFSAHSRAFDRMQHFVGGEPYFFFTALAAVYNEFLINRAAEALSSLKPGTLIEAAPIESTQAELESRYRIFVGYLRPMIPNLFRYNAESSLFSKIHERRGISIRREAIERELANYETIAHDFENLNLQRSNSQFNSLVFILALWSAFGALVTAAALFVALHSDSQEERIAEFAVDYSRYSVYSLMEISFWTAFAGLNIAVLASFLFLIRTLWRALTRAIGNARRRRDNRYKA